MRVRTTGRAGSERLLRLKNKSQLLQHFIGSQSILPQPEEPSEANEEHAQTNEKEEGDQMPQAVDRESCDLQIVLGLPEQQKVCLISQLVDISGDEEEVA